MDATQNELTTLPATIELRVRDGVPNVLAEFDLLVFSTLTPEQITERNIDMADDAVAAHEIDLRGLVQGLAVALQQRIARMREQYGDEFDETEHEKWLEELLNWVIGEA